MTVDADPANKDGAEDDSWSKLEITIAGAIVVAVAIGVAMLVSGSGAPQGSGSAPPIETATPEAIERASPPPAEVGTRISLEQFMAHALQFAEASTPLMRRLTDAVEAGDLLALGAAADELDVLVEADLEWQRANADRILGGCYDAAAAAYSDGVVELASATNYTQMYVESYDADLPNLIADSMTAFADDIDRFQTEAANANC